MVLHWAAYYEGMEKNISRVGLRCQRSFTNRLTGETRQIDKAKEHIVKLTFSFWIEREEG